MKREQEAEGVGRRLEELEQQVRRLGMSKVDTEEFSRVGRWREVDWAGFSG